MLDTIVLIDILNGDKRAETKLNQMKSNAFFYTTTINIYEVLRGIHTLKKEKGKHLLALKLLTNNLTVLDIDLAASEEAAMIYSSLRSKGIEIDEADYLIAGACMSNGIRSLMTRNEKH